MARLADSYMKLNNTAEAEVFALKALQYGARTKPHCLAWVAVLQDWGKYPGPVLFRAAAFP